MIEYIVVFLLSAGLFKLSYKSYKSERYREYKIFFFLGIILPALLAGFRGIEIGTDVQNYALPLFKIAQNNNIIGYYSSSFLNSYNTNFVASIEPGYNIMVFLSSKIFPSVNGLLFINQFLIMLFIGLGIKKYSKNNDWSLAILVFYFMFYNETLNMMRQGISLSIIFFAFSYLLEKKYKKYIYFVLLSILFHVSGMIGIFLLIFYSLYYWKGSRWKSTTFIVLFLVILTFWEPLIELFIDWGIIPGKYIYYLYGSVNIAKVNMMTLFKIPVVLLSIVYYRKMKKNNKYFGFLLLVAVFDLLFAQLRNIQVYAYRIGLYWSYIKMYLIWDIMSVNKIRFNRRVLQVFIFTFLFVYWYYIYVHLGYNETVPYKNCF